MDVIDNINKRLYDDMVQVLHKGSRLSFAAAYFSIYAFEKLKKELADIDELRFIFTEPSFLTQKENKEKREFYIPRLNRERSLYGTEFEIQLRNKLGQKAIARECAEWLRKKAQFKSNAKNLQVQNFMLVDDTAYSPVRGFTTVDLGLEQGNDAFFLIQKVTAPYSQMYMDSFNMLWQDKDKLEDVTELVINSIASAYNENAPEFIYFIVLYNIFHEFLTDISEDELPNDKTGFKDSRIWQLLYNFQRDAALGIISKLEKYNGCILADSVGLGKTFTALAVIKYYENRNKSVLVLCPKKLADNWNTYKANYVNNPVSQDRLNYDVLFHTDLNRTHGQSNGIDLGRINWSNYDLVLIDESHNFRNGGQIDDDGKENRYSRLMNKVIRAGVKTKVLMLSATPVNNRFNDLRNQLQLAYEGNVDNINSKLELKTSVDDVFRLAQKAYNEWAALNAEERTLENLLKSLSFDFFNLLDAVTIARSRKHIEKYYDTADIGKFPLRLPPKSLRPQLTDLAGGVNYKEIFASLMNLELSIYTPSAYIMANKKAKYAEMYGDEKVNVGFTQAARERGIRRLMSINLMKRMESSVHSFRLTLQRIYNHIDGTVQTIEAFKHNKNNACKVRGFAEVDMRDLDMDDENYVVGGKVVIRLEDMDYISWSNSLLRDLAKIKGLLEMVADITPEHDTKLNELKRVIADKQAHPVNDGNKKLLIFTAFADTAEYLYEHVSQYVKGQFGLNSAMITGSVDGRSTIKGLRCDLNTVLTYFSPLSKDKAMIYPDDDRAIDVLIATDCISEGQNLQDCDYLINYDIHWNPVRIIQRFGRVDRIGSQNDAVQLVNFWPDMDLDEYINLKGRVESRMKIVDLTATGDDNLLSNTEKMDLQYRKKQLERLQKEVVDLEDIGTNVSIMDLGLNEFRMDLLAYCKQHGDMDKVPFGLHGVVKVAEDCPPGVIFVLKNNTANINIASRNILHPFYMVYMREDGEVVCDHLSPKKLLDKIRLLCKNKQEPDTALCSAFNQSTDDGRDMSMYSDLLGQAIASIIQNKEQSDVESFLSGDDFSFFDAEIKGLDDFELISFLVVKD